MRIRQTEKLRKEREIGLWKERAREKSVRERERKKQGYKDRYIVSGIRAVEGALSIIRSLVSGGEFKELQPKEERETLSPRSKIRERNSQIPDLSPAWLC